MNPYDLTSYDGRRVDWITRAALQDAAVDLGYPLTLTQGSYNAGAVPASAGTHDGGGVVDLAPFDHARKVAALRRLGFAAWYRPAIAGLWPAHVHAVLIGNRKLSAGARAQVAEYLAGFDGLTGDGRDTGPRQWVDRRYRWERGAQRIARARALAARAAALIDHDVRGHRGVRRALRHLRAAQHDLPKG